MAFRLHKQSIHLNATGSQIAEHYFRLMEASLDRVGIGPISVRQPDRISMASSLSAGGPGFAMA